MMKRKPLFDTIRHMLGRGFTQEEVNRLDNAIDALAICNAGSMIEPANDGSHTIPQRRRASANCIALIKRFEGCAKIRTDGRVEAYPDPGTGGAPWTIGWGATGPDIGPSTIWSQAKCDGRLLEDIVRHAREVDQAIGDAPTSQAQFDALVSFHFNTGAIGRATLTQKHCSGDFRGAASEFARWNKAGGRALRGLMARREAESALYSG